MRNKSIFDVIKKPKFLDNVPDRMHGGMYAKLLDTLQDLNEAQCVTLNREEIGCKTISGFKTYANIRAKQQSRDFAVRAYHDTTHELVYVWKK